MRVAGMAWGQALALLHSGAIEGARHGRLYLLVQRGNPRPDGTQNYAVSDHRTGERVAVILRPEGRGARSMSMPGPAVRRLLARL